jgi:hypothetical protein
MKTLRCLCWFQFCGMNIGPCVSLLVVFNLGIFWTNFLMPL